MIKLPRFLTGIIASIIAFVLFLISVLVFSLFQDANLVEPDYYSEDQAYQSKIDALTRTHQLESTINVRYNSSVGILINIPELYANQQVTGKIQLYRPSDHLLDRYYNLTPSAGEQVISTNGLLSGLWVVKISWLMDGMDYYSQTQVVID
ncbi:MAG: FixH family protein [Candidatus Marinimicrobia bacterium]|nr:FixH family protein [Candidatus Neomarinimicrobiota bacterium]